MTELQIAILGKTDSVKQQQLHQSFCQKFQDHQFPFLHSSSWISEHAQLQDVLLRFTSFQELLIFGTGGSSLGGQALYALCDSLQLSSKKLIFVDDIDPEILDRTLRAVSPTTTGFVVISKSGFTAETLAQVLALESYAFAQPLDFRQQFLFITHDQDTPLSRIAKKHGSPVIPHPENIGGRYSVLTAVGAVIAMLAGLSLKRLHQGAASMMQNILTNPDHSVFQVASQMYKAFQQGFSNQVIMTYCHKLTKLQDWYRQLTAESLGKNGMGITPILAKGTIDQHSQLQLYLDGPRDKYYTFLTYDPQVTLAMTSDDPELGYLNGRSVRDLYLAEALATRTSIEKRGIPSRHIHVCNLNEYALGELFVYFMVETLLLADLLLVNPFDQPAVEEGKTMTRTFMLA